MKLLDDLMKIKVDIANRTVIRILALVLALGIGVKFVLATAPALVLIFIAFFLAVALNPAVDYFQRLWPKGGRALATSLTYLIGISLLVILSSTIIPPLVQQTRDLVENLPSYIEQLTEANGPLAGLAQDYDITTALKNTQGEIVGQLSSAGQPLLNIFQRIANSVIAVLTVLVLTFFMLLEAPAWKARFWKLQPEAKRARRRELTARMYRVVTGYVNGQVFIAMLSGTAALIMMFILGVPFAVPLAAIVAVFSLIPLIGATLAAIIVVIVALFQSVTTALILAVFFLIYQQIENNFIQPIVQSRSVEMSALEILLAAILGVTVAGLLGALIAIPVAACLRILLVDYVKRHYLVKL